MGSKRPRPPFSALRVERERGTVPRRAQRGTQEAHMNESLVRHVLFPLHERLKRKPTFRWLGELERTQWLSPEQIAEYQFARLRRLVEFAYANVPYYRVILDEYGIPPLRLQSLHDLRDFPFLTRDLIRSR